jgi:O-antigen/teichoic acid export membrane protein
MDRLEVKTSQIGGYSFAYMFGSYMDFFGNAVGMAIGPLYTKLFSEKSKSANVSVHFLTHWLQSSFMLLCFIVALWMKEFFSILVTNPDLTNLYGLGIIIVMGYAYRPYYWVSISRLQYNENTSQLWKISFLAGVVNVVLNIIFIPIYGIIAAAVSTFIALLYVGFSGFYLKAFKTNETEVYHPFKVVVLIIISTSTVFMLRAIEIESKCGITIFLSLVYILYWYKNRSGFSQINWE